MEPDPQAIRPARRLTGTLRVPGDKSISHRALLVAGVGEGRCEIRAISDSLDVATSLAALSKLGVSVTRNPQSLDDPQKLSTLGLDWQLLVEGRGWDSLAAPREPIDLGNSGTTARTLLGILAGRTFETHLFGDKSLSRRPMDRVVRPLRAMGATVEGEDDHLPLRIRGGELRGISHRSPVASAQIKTALIFAGLQATGTTMVEEPSPSRDHTERLLEYLKVPIDRSPHGVSVKSTSIQNASVLDVPGDLSSAAFLLVGAALLPGSEVTVTEVGLNPTRTGILDLLEIYGAEVRIEDRRDVCGEPRGTVSVRSGDRRPLSVSGADVVRSVDELPLVAVMGAFAEGDTVIADAAELRIKESDRIQTAAAGLRALGGTVETTPDGMVVHGTGGLAGGRADAAGDHRIAMALAVAALASRGPSAVAGWDSVAISYPGFLQAVEHLAER